MKPHPVRRLLVLLFSTWSVTLGQSPTVLFDAPVVIGDSQTRFRAALHYDSDAFADLVSVWFPTDSSILVRGYRGDGAGNFSLDWSFPFSGIVPIAPNNEPAAPIAVGDFNGDGLDDFALAVNQLMGYWLSNGAGVAPTIAWVWQEPAIVGQVLTADFNGDGLADVVLQQGLEIRIYLTQLGAPPLLASTATFASSYYGGQIFVTEINGDGTPDVGVLTSNFLNGQFQLYAVVGTVLQPPVVYAIPTGSEAFAVSGDIDQDGDVDVVRFGAQVDTLRRTGVAAFTLEPQYSGGPATHLVDFDGDGDLDGVGAWPGNLSPKCTISFNGGAGNFGLAGDFVFPGLPIDNVAPTTLLGGALDVNQDGAVDLIAGRCIYYGRGPFSNPPVVGGTTLKSARDVLDFDADGDLDVHPGGTAFLQPFGTTTLNQGDGTFVAAISSVAPPPNNAWAGPGFPGDFDGDGDVDFLVDATPGVTPNGTTHLLRNLGCGAFVDAGQAAAASMRFIPSVNVLMDQQPRNSIVADLDGDGDQDFVGAYLDPGAFTSFGTFGHSKIWWNQGSGTFVAGPDLPSFLLLAAVDLTQDGIVDLVGQYHPATAGAGMLIALAGVGAGSFAPLGAAIVIDSDTHRVNVPAIGDFDSDGDLDVFSVGNHAATLFTNLSPGVFGAPVSYPALAPPPVNPLPGQPVAPPPRRAFAVDLDMDGLVDVAVCPFGTGETAFMRRNGPGGTFGTPISQVFQAVTFADVDGDGDSDALAGNRIARNLVFAPPSGGGWKQYGTGIAGSAGITPILGASGPFRPLNVAALRIVGGPGGASGALAVGSGPANIPLFGGTLLITVTSTFPIQLGGTPGVPGVGSMIIPFTVPPSVALTSVWLQVGLFDGGAPAGISGTNGLRLDYGL